MGHTFKIVGKIVKGQGLGKKSLYPTINVDVKDFIVPKDGVYASLSEVDGFCEPSVTFIGNRLSTDNRFSIETYIIGKDIKEAKGEAVILFLDRIRDNKKYDSLNELKEQIKKDIDVALNIVKEHTI